MHFQYITISRGGNSIIEKLKELGIDPSKYIGWYSLRNWGKQVPPATTTDNTTGTINAAANATAAATTSAATSPQMDASKPRTRGASLPAVNASKSPKRDSSLPALNAFKSPKMVASPSLADASKSPKKAATPSLPSHLDPEYVEEDGREFYVSELVYIHDKIMIVDDRIVLIGSGRLILFFFQDREKKKN
jgi:phosphatidylserine/phosphatidylglycerophosphate/cardiolipin synthase-like enzyme